MIRNFTILFFLCLSGFVLKADINYTDYGAGLVIPMGAEHAIDVDNDGTIDFYINKELRELGISPISAKGCLTSPGYDADTQWGARQFMLHPKGDLINLTNANMFDYIEEVRGAGYSASEGLAVGWADSEDVYLGFAVFSTDLLSVSNGWMRVNINVVDETFIIKDLAYTDKQSLGAEGIRAGDKGFTSAVEELDASILSVNIFPNPVDDLVNISYDYTAQNALTLGIYNVDGRLIQTEKLTEVLRNNIQLNTADWVSGIYYIRFNSDKGIKTKRLIVSH